MKQPARPRVLALVLPVMLSLAFAAHARILAPDRPPTVPDRLTVVLADGWELPDVAAAWYADEGVLVVEREDGARRTLTPEELAGLRDAAGRDVTAEVLPAWAVARLGGVMPPAAPRPQPSPQPQPPPRPQPAPRPPEMPERPWRDFAPEAVPEAAPARSSATADPRVVFGLELGYAVPHDQHFAGYDGGAGFEALLRLQIAGPLYLSGGYLYQTLQSPGFYPMPLYDPIEGDAYCYPSYSERATIHGPWVGLSLVSTARSPRPVRFYLEGGVGRLEVEDLPLWSWDDSYLGYRLSTGFLIPTGDRAAFTIGVRALHMPQLDTGWNPDHAHTMLGVTLGLSLLGF
ncbi:MAG: hypothetical protein R3D98_04475 [Candidatus Krumholzibacteriia bacterium]